MATSTNRPNKRFIYIAILFLACSLLMSGWLLGNQSTSYVPQEATFVDVASDVGLDFTHGAFNWSISADPVAMMGGGLCWLDYDNDGWLDLYVVNSYALEEAGSWDALGERPSNSLYRNQNGQFTDVGAESKSDLSVRGNGCVAADLNLDGWVDIYITTSRVNQLLWNNGDGTFSEGAVEAGVDSYGWQTGVAVGDLNADGWPDLFVAGYVDLNNRIPGATTGFPNTFVGRRDLLYLSRGADSDGNVTFSEVGEAIGLETDNFEYGLGALLTDLDNDGDLDLYVANDTNPNRLYRNDVVVDDPAGFGFRFVDIGSQSHVDDDNSGMGVAGGDYDNNGFTDLFITNLGRQLHSIYRNESQNALRFANGAHSIGIDDIGVGWTGWGTSWADFDHDTDLDLFVVNGNIPVADLIADGHAPHLFVNLSAGGETGRLSDRTNAAQLNNVSILGRGSAVADYDNDGDLDVVIASIGGGLVLLQNQITSGNWLAVEFEEFAPGGTVTVTLYDGTRLQREVYAGSSYLASEDPRCHFGVGSEEWVRSVVVTWPNGDQQMLRHVRTNQRLTFAAPAP